MRRSRMPSSYVFETGHGLCSSVYNVRETTKRHQRGRLKQLPPECQRQRQAIYEIKFVHRVPEAKWILLGRKAFEENNESFKTSAFMICTIHIANTSVWYSLLIFIKLLSVNYFIWDRPYRCVLSNLYNILVLCTVNTQHTSNKMQ